MNIKTKDISYFDLSSYKFVTEKILKNSENRLTYIDDVNELAENRGYEVESYEYALLLPYITAVYNEDQKNELDKSITLGNKIYNTGLDANEILNKIYVKIHTSKILEQVNINQLSTSNSDFSLTFDSSQIKNLNLTAVNLSGDGYVYQPNDNIKNEIKNVLGDYIENNLNTHNYSNVDFSPYFKEENGYLKFIPLRINGVYPSFEFNGNVDVNLSFQYKVNSEVTDGTETSTDSQYENISKVADTVVNLLFTPKFIFGNEGTNVINFGGEGEVNIKLDVTKNIVYNFTILDEKNLQLTFRDGEIEFKDLDNSQIIKTLNSNDSKLYYEYTKTESIDSTTTADYTAIIDIDFSDYFQSSPILEYNDNITHYFTNNNLTVKVDKYSVNSDNPCKLDLSGSSTFTSEDNENSELCIAFTSEDYVNYINSSGDVITGDVTFNSKSSDNKLEVYVNTSLIFYFSGEIECFDLDSVAFEILKIETNVPLFNNNIKPSSYDYPIISAVNEDKFGYYCFYVGNLIDKAYISYISHYSNLPLAIFDKKLVFVTNPNTGRKKLKNKGSVISLLYPIIKTGNNNFKYVDFSKFKDNYIIDFGGIFILARIKISPDYMDAYNIFCPKLYSKNVLPITEYYGLYPFISTDNNLEFQQVLQHQKVAYQQSISSTNRFNLTIDSESIPTVKIFKFSIENVIPLSDYYLEDNNLNYRAVIKYNPEGVNTTKTITKPLIIDMKNPKDVVVYIRDSEFTSDFPNYTSFNLSVRLERDEEIIKYQEGKDLLLAINKPYKEEYDLGSYNIKIETIEDSGEIDYTEPNVENFLENKYIKYIGQDNTILYNSCITKKDFRGTAFYYYSLDTVFTNTIEFAPVTFKYTPWSFSFAKFNSEAKVIKDLNISIKYSYLLQKLLSDKKIKVSKIVYRRHISSIHNKNDPDNSNIILFTGEINKTTINDNKIIISCKTTNIDQDKLVTTATTPYCRQEFKSRECGATNSNYKFCNKTLENCIEIFGSKEEALKHYGGFLKMLDNTKSDYIDKI